jgi:hypothetical protein
MYALIYSEASSLRADAIAKGLRAAGRDSRIRHLSEFKSGHEEPCDGVVIDGMSPNGARCKDRYETIGQRVFVVPVGATDDAIATGEIFTAWLSPAVPVKTTKPAAKPSAATSDK